MSMATSRMSSLPLPARWQPALPRTMAAPSSSKMFQRPVPPECQSRQCGTRSWAVPRIGCGPEVHQTQHSSHISLSSQLGSARNVPLTFTQPHSCGRFHSVQFTQLQDVLISITLPNSQCHGVALRARLTSACSRTPSSLPHTSAWHACTQGAGAALALPAAAWAVAAATAAVLLQAAWDAAAGRRMHAPLARARLCMVTLAVVTAPILLAASAASVAARSSMAPAARLRAPPSPHAVAQAQRRSAACMRAVPRLPAALHAATAAAHTAGTRYGFCCRGRCKRMLHCPLLALRRLCGGAHTSDPVP
jgi:hypothetical protein